MITHDGEHAARRAVLDLLGLDEFPSDGEIVACIRAMKAERDDLRGFRDSISYALGQEPGTVSHGELVGLASCRAFQLGRDMPVACAAFQTSVTTGGPATPHPKTGRYPGMLWVEETGLYTVALGQGEEEAYTGRIAGTLPGPEEHAIWADIARAHADAWAALAETMEWRAKNPIEGE